MDQELTPLVEAWITSRLARRRVRSDHTVRAYRADMARWSRALAPARPATTADLTPEHLDAAVLALRDAGLAVATRRRMDSTLRGFCRWAHARGHLAGDPTLDPDFGVRGASERRLPVFFNDDELSRIVLACSTPPKGSRVRWSPLDRALLTVLLSTGVRASELCSMAPRDLRTQAGVRVLRVVGKGSKERQIPLAPEAARIVDRWLATRQGVARDTGTVLGPANVLFVDEQGRPVTGSRLDTRVRSWLAQADVDLRPGAVTHAFRHTFAHRLVTNGVPMPVVSELLGHADLRTTSVYTRVSTADTVEAVSVGALTATLRGFSTASGAGSALVGAAERGGDEVHAEQHRTAGDGGRAHDHPVRQR